jgi:hypothetical protein
MTALVCIWPTLETILTTSCKPAGSGSTVEPNAMCGRRPRCKRNLLWLLAVGCKSCVRPLVAAHDRWPDVIRGSGPLQKSGHFGPLAISGCLDPLLDRFTSRHHYRNSLSRVDVASSPHCRALSDCRERWRPIGAALGPGRPSNARPFCWPAPPPRASLASSAAAARRRPRLPCRSTPGRHRRRQRVASSADHPRPPSRLRRLHLEFFALPARDHRCFPVVRRCVQCPRPTTGT